MELRGYQKELKAEARSLMLRGVKSLLIEAPTGAGKTALTASMLKDAALKGMTSWFVNHRRELINQSHKTFLKFGVPHGIIASSYIPEPSRLIQICSIGTLANRYKFLPKPKFIVWDEAHHVAAKTWAEIRRYFPDTFHVGLTATPERLDGKGLRDYFGHIVNGPKVAWLIENGYLSKYRAFAPSSISTQGIRKVGGDFVKSELAAIMDKPTITGNNIAEYQRHARGKRNVIFAVNIEHSRHIVEQYVRAGISAEHVDGTFPSHERDAILARFASGQTLVLSNVDLFGEGFDLPEIEVVSMLRPTGSMAMFRQQVGRALRPTPGKEYAIILDHVGNIERHGLPDDDVEWSLDGKEHRKSASGGGPSVRICPKCFNAQYVSIKICQGCGHEFEVKARVIDEAAGELMEVDPSVIRQQKRIEQVKAESLEDLIALAKRRGFKRPEGWAKHVYQARQAKRLKGRN